MDSGQDCDTPWQRTESEFQILWRAGDRSWATYREVAHLNALDRYCELMGVKTVAELPSNYINRDSESEQSEQNIIQLKTCSIVNKRMNRRKGNNNKIPHIPNSQPHSKNHSP
jgi:hypothetical protein